MGARSLNPGIGEQIIGAAGRSRTIQIDNGSGFYLLVRTGIRYGGTEISTRTESTACSPRLSVTVS